MTGWVSEGSWRTAGLEAVGSGSGTVFGSAEAVPTAVAAGSAGVAVKSVPADLAAAAGFAAAVAAADLVAVDAGAAEDAEAVGAGSSGMR